MPAWLSSMTISSGPTALFVVRAWLEGPLPEGFRARVSAAPELTGAEPEVVNVAEPEAVLRLLGEWLTSVTERP